MITQTHLQFILCVSSKDVSLYDGPFKVECWLGEERLGDDSSNGGGTGRQQQ